MDINQLKSNWQSSFKHEELSRDQIEARLRIRGKSDDILKKILNNYKYSLIALAILYLIFTAGLFIFLQKDIVYLIFALVTVLLGYAASYSIKSYRQIRFANTPDNDVKTALTKTIFIMEKALRFGMGNLYRYLLVPLSLIFGVMIGIIIGAGDEGILETIYNLETKSIIKIVLVIVVGTGVTIPFSKFMMSRMYKQHLDELKECLKELNENHSL